MKRRLQSETALSCFEAGDRPLDVKSRWQSTAVSDDPPILFDANFLRRVET